MHHTEIPGFVGAFGDADTGFGFVFAVLEGSFGETDVFVDGDPGALRLGCHALFSFQVSA
jgi:hypothetical protein